MSHAELIALQQQLLGRYSLERELGRGGMGVVYLARDIRLDRPVAIKALHPSLAVDPEARSRFLHEARTGAALAHPHIVPIYAVEEHGATPILVMAMIDGETVGERLRRRGPVSPDEAGRILREVAWALDHAHAHGVVHRDLTLENILLERQSGRALLSDFGLARRSDLPDTGPLLGTPSGLAPELIRGDPATPASDLYALGIAGWTILTGSLPFTGEPAAVLAKHLVQPAPPLAPLAPGASPKLVVAIMQCLDKDPDARPASAAAFLGALERVTEPIVVAPPLREWFTRWERIAPIYSIGTPLLALQTWLLAMAYFRYAEARYAVAAMVSTAISLSIVPLGAHLLFELSQLRRLHSAGFTLADVHAATPHFRATELVQQQREGLRPLASRLIRDLAVVFGVVVVLDILFVEPNLALLETASQAVRLWFAGLAGFMPSLYLLTMIGIGIGFVSPGFRIAPHGRLRRLMDRFWSTRIAKHAERLAAIGQRMVAPRTSTLHRPTEMVLGLAVDDLWRAIPADRREEFGDVPALAHSLERGATELRSLIHAVEASERDLDVPVQERAALSEHRETLERRHRDAIATLERIRLQLLRTLADRHRTVDLAAQLEAARELEGALVRTIAGQAEVRRLLRGTRPRPSRGTPTPTPPTRVAA